MKKTLLACAALVLSFGLSCANSTSTSTQPDMKASSKAGCSESCWDPV